IVGLSWSGSRRVFPCTMHRDGESIDVQGRPAVVVVVCATRDGAASCPPASLFEGQPRVARKWRAGFAVSKAAYEIGLDVGTCKNLAIDARVIEAGHGATVKAKSARRKDQVGALQAAVA